MDEHAYLWANKLLNNPATAAALEITLGPCCLQFHCATIVALTGAASGLWVDEHYFPSWQTVAIAPGATVRVELPKAGLRSYLAVAGGVNVQSPLPSLSMVPREASGPFHGQPLTAGQQLQRGLADSPQPQPQQHLARSMPKHFIPDYRTELTLRIALMAMPEPLSSRVNTALFSQAFTLHPDSSRMAVRLGEPLGAYADFGSESFSSAMYSSGTVFGAVQLPGDARPIILLKDRQTIGGYPHIGSVAAQDCFALSQRRPGQRVRFVASDIATHQRALRAFYQFFLGGDSRRR